MVTVRTYRLWVEDRKDLSKDQKGSLVDRIMEFVRRFDGKQEDIWEYVFRGEACDPSVWRDALQAVLLNEAIGVVHDEDTGETLKFPDSLHIHNPVPGENTGSVVRRSLHDAPINNLLGMSHDQAEDL